ncbi:MAG: hypothetical protein LBI53_08085 [Candidatus Peribacteria bacterium]|nr:hypothetical protein [Candidatus Peribacteria bacterium]
MNIFNPRNDGEIIEVLHSLEKKDLEEIFLAILKKLDTQKTSKIFVDNINQIVEKMETLNPTISPQWNTRLEGNKTYKEPLRQKRQQSIPSIVT